MFRFNVTERQVVIDHNISNMDQVIKLSGILNQNSGFMYTLPYLGANEDGWKVELGTSKTFIYMKLDTRLSLPNYAIIIIEYTKTTD